MHVPHEAELPRPNARWLPTSHFLTEIQLQRKWMSMSVKIVCRHCGEKVSLFYAGKHTEKCVQANLKIVAIRKEYEHLEARALQIAETIWE